MLVSAEADLIPREHPERADLIDGAIGEASPFHEAFGYYAHGVAFETALAPPGWRERLVPIRNENTRGATGWCLEAHDLVLAKLVAGREKDVAFARAALADALVRLDLLLERAATLPVDERTRLRISGMLPALAAS